MSKYVLVIDVNDKKLNKLYRELGGPYTTAKENIKLEIEMQNVFKVLILEKMSDEN
jgi:hypothetical protein